MRHCQLDGPSARADTVRLTRRLRDPIPIRDDEWEERTRRYRNIKSEYPGTVCEPDRQPRPPAKPAFRWFGLDDVGQLWVEVYCDDGFTFEVFDSSGALIGSMRARHRDSRITPYVGQDRVVVVTRDTLDVHYVEVYSRLAALGALLCRSAASVPPWLGSPSHTKSKNQQRINSGIACSPLLSIVGQRFTLGAAPSQPPTIEIQPLVAVGPAARQHRCKMP